MNTSSTPTTPASLRPPSRARAAAVTPRQRRSPLRRTLGATMALALTLVGVGVGIVAGEPATASAAP